MTPRWLSLTLLCLLAGAWSLAMGVLGMWLLFEPQGGVLGSVWVSGSAGLLALGAAQVVFLLCVLDRVFPAPHGWVRGTIYSGNMLILGVAALVLIPASLIASV